MESHNITALPAGSIITVTWNADLGARAAVAANFTGVSPANPLDQWFNGWGESITAFSYPAATTTQMNELLVGGFGINAPITETFTAVLPYTFVGCAATTGDTATSNIKACMEYWIVSSSGRYNATGTLSTARKWGVVMATFK